MPHQRVISKSMQTVQRLKEKWTKCHSPVSCLLTAAYFKPRALLFVAAANRWCAFFFSSSKEILILNDNRLTAFGVYHDKFQKCARLSQIIYRDDCKQQILFLSRSLSYMGFVSRKHAQRLREKEQARKGVEKKMLS